MITDKTLIDMSKLANGETLDFAQYMAFSDSSTFSLDATASSTPGYTDSTSTTKFRENNLPELNINGIKTGALASSTGDTIYGAVLTPADSNEDAQALASVPGILHTQDFDLEVNWTVSFERV